MLHTFWGSFKIRRSERRAMLVGAKQFLHVTSLFMVQFCHIRYESSARLVDHLNFSEIHKIGVKNGLYFMGVNVMNFMLVFNTV